ncbi:formyltetrahydrofolate deformylase [Limnobacter humi]|uniref:Formyltetrahydrofolate deformylase n=1 Tax=Limnobacter humi TaxID=1778671 RepID=A0ABT1WFG9_9BURK|nr:formyltetrahydrofolate deformylase [Limnobacter humi]MCQ8895179.1 formyltetrahydrofolate deformylase [Limnobacter humi]
MRDYILTISCPDTTGIVYNVSKFLFDLQCNILDSAQFGDESTNLFFLRVHFALPNGATLTQAALNAQFESVARQFNMTYQFNDARVKPRVLLMVSKFGHCLNDLLFRWKSGNLPCDIPAIVSNHQDFALLAASYGVPFYHLPVNNQNKGLQETQIRQIMERERIDLMVLARYMQILSPEFCAELPGRIINIHHSFLPSFKGAKPYQQAFDRGVKLIGATAHYVTSDLDEGPIIEQDVARVDHSLTPEELTSRGRDTECMVLARAVKWHCEHRVVLNGHKTVVFQ